MYEPVLHRAFEKYVVSQPDAVAVTYAGQHLTYAGLDARAERIAGRLEHARTPRGATVAILAEQGLEQVVAMLGVLKHGAGFVVLGPRQPRDRIAHVLATAAPAAAIVDTRVPAELFDRLDLSVPVLTIAASASSTPTEAISRGAAVPSGDDLAYIAFTSGSTGVPKGIPHRHRTLSQFVSWQSSEMNIGPGSRVAQFAPPGFDVSFCEIFGALCHGASLHIVSDEVRDDPADVVAWLRDEEINLLQVVPSHWAGILADSERYSSDGLSGLELPHLHTVMFVGEALPSGLVTQSRQRVRNRLRLVNVYGPTEVVAATFHDLGTDETVTAGDDSEGATVPIGRAIPGREIVLVGDAPPREIQIRSEFLTAGYLGAARNDDHFVADASAATGIAYRTGDLAYELGDGILLFAGRSDNQVKIRGQRVELEEVEATLTRTSTVDAAAATVRPMSSGTVGLVAFVVPVDPETFVPETERKQLADFLPRYMVPDHLVVVSDLPRNVNGKIDRSALQHLDVGSGPETHGESDPDRVDEIEQDLTRLWCDLLNRSEIDREASLFTLGGDSVLATRILSRVRTQLGVRVRLGTFFDNPTIAGLADAVRQPAQRTR